MNRMKLYDLIGVLPEKTTIGNTEAEIADLEINSKLVREDSLFICLKGTAFDSHSCLSDLEAYGCAAIVCERKLETKIPQIIVPDSRAAMSLLAAQFYGNPAKKLKLIAVSGTNGKTTTCHILRNILAFAGKKAGVIGTLGVFYGEVFFEPELTTPDPIRLQKIFRDMADAGVEYVVMEASAHAIYLKKLEGLYFEIGIFTNLTQDHLDFFSDMERYKAAKLRFFHHDFCRYLLVNSDDPAGVEIMNGEKDVLTYGIENPADVFAIDVESTSGGNCFVMNLFDRIFEIKSELYGSFNVYNCLAAAAAAALLGIPTEAISEGIFKIRSVEGRMEPVAETRGAKIFVDYAHTPDGLEKALIALKKSCKGRLICVFGCGGNRDKGKREIMGAVAGRCADFTVITSDNPRFEEPMEIIYAVEKGLLTQSDRYVIVQNRREGIRYALDYAKKGDVILVAGKGAEKYQEILGIKHDYNDKDTIMELCAADGDRT